MNFWQCPHMLGYGCALGVSAGSSNVAPSLIQTICWNSDGANESGIALVLFPLTRGLFGCAAADL
jgi:hypothetical protein